MIELKVNGTSRKFDGDPDMPLLWYLRDLLELTGTKFGCGMGLCGSCTVHVNGAAQRSCVTSMKDAAGKNITTIEGLDMNHAHPVQVANASFSPLNEPTVDGHSRQPIALRGKSD